jgi:hypothetical protein
LRAQRRDLVSVELGRHDNSSLRKGMLNSLLLPTALFTVIATFGFVFPTNLDVTKVVPVPPTSEEEPLLSDEPIEAEVAEETLASYENTFRCTIYYTPKESGFTAEAGFDTSPETRPGLNGKLFPRDFLLAVQKEGYGRLKAPANGCRYVSYFRGEWKFAEAPLDCRGKPLIARRSCAVKAGHKLIRLEARLRVCGSRVPQEFDDLRWTVTDTGSGLSDGQIDLYWGDDEPSGPGRGITFPKGSHASIEQATILVLR